MVKAKGDKSSTVVPVLPSSKPSQSPKENAKTSVASASSTPEHASLSSLSICRNKHWRFISSFHGPWLQLPHELLESLAIGNYFSARPHVIDAGVFFDVVRIRRLIDEATNLSVRAVNGTSSSALSTSLNAGHGQRRGGETMKLSGERRFRMRELAVKKLSEAYHLDEVAASVATMQSASSLEDVAKMVLQRAPNDAHAKYVHFFHEKIPSRALAESTSLTPLNEILQDPSVDCAVLRTRALTRIFKEDFTGAARDLTEALNNLRRDVSQHPASSGAMDNAANTNDQSISILEMKHDTQKLTDDAKPTGIEMQLYFQRAGIYLSSACHSVEKALQAKLPVASKQEPSSHTAPEAGSGDAIEAYRKVKLNAKRALRDFTAFLSKLQYSPGSANMANASMSTSSTQFPRLTEDETPDSPLSEDTTLVLGSESSANVHDMPRNSSHTVSVRIYQVSDLFSATPPSNLPAFPAESLSIVTQSTNDNARVERFATNLAERSEMVSYHPLLTEALHGLLLCHALLQTEASQIRKHAYMTARLVSLSDGFPVFVAARSASRADWVDILSQTKSWLDINSSSWDALCKPSAAPTGASSRDVKSQSRRSSEKHLKDRHKHESALTNGTHCNNASDNNNTSSAAERLQTNKALHAAADAMSLDNVRDGTGNTNNKNKNDSMVLAKTESATPARAADLKTYSLGTERADIIARWILDAPVLPDAPSKASKPRKNKKKCTTSPAV